VRKKFVELRPYDPDDLAAADQHYLDIHFQFAAATFQDIQAVRAYHTNRAVGQLDLTGGFGARPDAWRFVITQWEDAGDDHHVGWLPPRVRDLFFADRPGHIAGVESWEVAEEVVVDRRSGQLTSVKYLLTYPRTAASPDEADDRLATSDVAALAALATDAPGFRLLIINPVLRQAETRVRPDGISEYTGGYLARASMRRFDELWFDSELAADRFFRRPDVLALLRDGRCGKVAGYRVEELCGIDRR
jgi:hypothetical protein